tara:strand:+ start:1563 stop:1811 length:249 start_codon:yes stop_codon:yes gene_type:complete
VLPDSSLFRDILHRMYLILKSNFLPEFYQKMLQIPTIIYRKRSYEEGLRFNSCGPNIKDVEQSRSSLSSAKSFKRSGNMQNT